MTVAQDKLDFHRTGLTVLQNTVRLHNFFSFRKGMTVAQDKLDCHRTGLTVSQNTVRLHVFFLLQERFDCCTGQARLSQDRFDCFTKHGSTARFYFIQEKVDCCTGQARQSGQVAGQVCLFILMTAEPSKKPVSLINFGLRIPPL